MGKNMSHIKDARDLAERLFDHGATNNENLRSLLIHLKEISESNADNLKSDFLEIFPDIDPNGEVLNSTNSMMSIFLTSLAMMAKPTAASNGFLESKQIENDLVLKLKEVDLSIKNYFASKI